MHIKGLIERALRRYPPAFQLGSKAYHALNGSFRSASPEAPDAVERAIRFAKRARGDDPGDYYEFGLFRGFTFLTAYEAAVRQGLGDMVFHGFDSFAGLPDLEADDRGDNQFFKGQFACSEEAVRANLAKRGMDLTRAQLIKGYYSDTLTDDLRASATRPFRTAAVVMLDCDLYSSTRDALDWLEPYLAEGTVLVFDDWHAYDDDPEQGQPRALREYLRARGNLGVEHVFDYERHGRVFVLHDRPGE